MAFQAGSFNHRTRAHAQVGMGREDETPVTMSILDIELPSSSKYFKNNSEIKTE